MAVEERRRAWFNFGRVFSRGFQSFGRAMAPAILIALIFVVAPYAVLIGTAGTISTAGDYERLMSSGMIAAWVGGAFAVSLVTLLGQTSLIHLALSAQQGRDVSFGSSLGVGFRLFLPTLGLGILVALGTMLGLLLLVVPGIILMVMWSVALPARIHSGPGVTAAMEESADLTKGVRWIVFALLLVAGVGFYILNQLAAAPIRLLPPQAAIIASTIIVPLTAGATSLAQCFGAASLFHELRWGDRDPHEDAAAEVFE
jgi:hypothetical protein